MGTTRREFGIGWLWPEFEDYSLTELRAAVVKGYGKGKGEQVIDALLRAHPEAPPCDLFALWRLSGARLPAVRQAAAKAVQNAAAVYVYIFDWNTPVLNGRIRSYRCAELPFVFDNTDRCDQATGGGPSARALAARVSEAWIQFACTGNPNHAQLPNWPAYRVANGDDDLR